MSVLAGCSGGSSEGSGKVPEAGQAAGPAARAKAFDPPLKFGEGVKPEYDEDVKTRGFALLGPRAYIRTDAGLDAYDVATGKKIWSSALVREGRYTGTAGEDLDDRQIPPVFVEQGDRTVALYAYSDHTKGTGTAVDRTDVYLRAVDADSGKVSWTTQLPAATGMGVGDMEPVVVGAQDGTVIVMALTSLEESSGDGESAVTYAVDVGTQRVKWQEQGFAASAVDSGIVAGAQVGDGAGFQSLLGWSADEDPLTLTGRSVTDGSVSWKDEGSRGLVMDPVGGGLFVSNFALHDIRTGKPAAGVDGGDMLSCYYDQQSVVVCEGDDYVWGVEASSRKVLWEISGENPARKLPSIEGALHGVVYGSTPDRVILDAKTGKDKTTFTGPSLYLVNEYAAMDIDMVTYPATG
ncbi:hypothetical protein AB0P41_14170 [Streptomyces sp. NPDC079167]|uniref:hypothetical protein n=1 Tax=Streptomyces sp. NPDC079167 TaxID=3154513 RepID=UPI003438D106